MHIYIDDISSLNSVLIFRLQQFCELDIAIIPCFAFDSSSKKLFNYEPIF